MEVEFVDRYSALGMRPPSPWTICRGRCEGMGIYPMPFEEWRGMKETPVPCYQRDESGEYETWPPPDGYAFVYCEECNGTGRRRTGRLAALLDAAHTYFYVAWWPLWAAKYEIQSGFVSRPGQNRWRVALATLPHNFRFIWREERMRRGRRG